MRFFIDSANIMEIRKAKFLGILDGVTTNPSLIAKAKTQTGKKFKDIIKEICEELEGNQPSAGKNRLPVSVEVLKINCSEMIEEGKDLANLAPNVVIKLPCTMDGLQACQELTKLGYYTNMTLCFSPLQALLVAKAGANYVSPFVGRMDDIGDNGLALVANIKHIYNTYQLPTKVLAASIRNPLHILECARMGVDVVTVPFSVIAHLMENDLTQKGLEIFLKDAREATQKQD